MPQIYIEYTDNILITNMKELVSNIHQLLSLNLPTPLQSCKTRVIKHSEFYIGDCSNSNSFFYVNIHVLKGRNKELLNSLAKQIEELLLSFLDKNNKPELQIIVSINELPEIYIKN